MSDTIATPIIFDIWHTDENLVERAKIADGPYNRIFRSLQEIGFSGGYAEYALNCAIEGPYFILTRRLANGTTWYGKLTAIDETKGIIT